MPLQNSIYALPLTWQTSSGGTMAAYQGYVINAGTSFGLPASPKFGDTYAISSYGATGGFVINAPGPNLIYYGNTTGASLTTIVSSASISMLCVSESPLAFTILYTTPNANFVLS